MHEVAMLSLKYKSDSNIVCLVMGKKWVYCLGVSLYQFWWVDILIGDTNLIVLVIKTITSTDSTPIIADATVDIDESFAFESHRSDAEKMVYNDFMP